MPVACWSKKLGIYGIGGPIEADLAVIHVPSGSSLVPALLCFAVFSSFCFSLLRPRFLS